MNFRGAGMSVERLVTERFKLRDRQEGITIVPFLPNAAQSRFLDLAHRVEQKGLRHRYISVKCRRVGLSRIIEAIGVAYMYAHPNFEGRVMAQRDDTAMDLANSAALMASGLPTRPRIRFEGSREYRRIIIPHREGAAILSRATAKSPGTGRGRGFNFGHFSEAAYYPVYAPFTGMLPTIATDPKRSFVMLESTGNGKIGLGQKFWDYWSNASDDPEHMGNSEFIRFFVPYTENPWCRSDPARLNERIPCNDEEKVLLAAGVDERNIAWRRVQIDTEYAGIVEDFAQENPITPDEAFISLGRPAFAHDEHSYVASTVCDPSYNGDLEYSPRHAGRMEFVNNPRGILKVWKMPQAQHEYCVGADGARGMDVDRPDAPPGDYAAAVVWDMTTGEQAAGLQARLNPRELAEFLDKLGRFYCTPELGDQHYAMLGIELTGNLGLETQRRLREDYHYPRYRFMPWRGKDDRVTKFRSLAIGWETTGRTREMMFTAFRTALREKTTRVYWKELARQMGDATMEESCWEVKRGHDDLLMAAMVGWMIRVQNPPQTIITQTQLMPRVQEEAEWPVYVNEDMRVQEQRHWDSMFKLNAKGKLALQSDARDADKLWESLMPQSSALVEW